MNSISDRLRAQIEAQATREDAQLLIDYLQEHPDGNPEHNAQLRNYLADPNSVDRGMHGPLGGKNGAVSQIWLEEWKRVNADGPSELSLITIIAPPASDFKSEN